MAGGSGGLWQQHLHPAGLRAGAPAAAAVPEPAGAVRGRGAGDRRRPGAAGVEGTVPAAPRVCPQGLRVTVLGTSVAPSGGSAGAPVGGVDGAAAPQTVLLQRSPRNVHFYQIKNDNYAAEACDTVPSLCP